MELRQLEQDRLEVADLHRTGRTALQRLGPPVLIGALVAIMIGTRSWSFAPILFGGALLLAFGRRRWGSTAVFDRVQGTVTLFHTDGKRQELQESLPLADIDKIIVEARSPEFTDETGTRRMPAFSQWKLRLRPALVVGTRIVPLTRSFGKGERPILVTRQIRTFLGQPDSDLLKDSVAALVRNDHTRKAGRHLARHVLDLDYFEADDLVRALRDERADAAEPDNERSAPARGPRARQPPFRLGYRQEGWMGALLYLLMFAAFIWVGEALL